MKTVKFAGYSVRVPNHPILRMMLGIIFVIGGFLWFLPVLGLWMLPFGLVILSVDFAIIRRWRRRATVKLGYWLMQRWPNLAQKVGYGPLRAGKI